MRYSVDELDAMPVGTVLVMPGYRHDLRHAYRKESLRDGRNVWAQYDYSHDVDIELLATMDFTHRADPQPIPQPAPAQPCDGEVQHGE